MNSKQCKNAELQHENSSCNAEAIKEFVKRLDALKKKRACVWSAEYEETVTMREIDNLAKEMKAP